MGKLNKMASISELMNIDITYGNVRHRFNLFEELEISESSLNKELKKHASSYAFLTMLRTHLLKEVKRLEALKKSTYSKIYSQQKKKTGAGGRPLNDDLAKANAESHSKYKSVIKRLIEAEHNYSIIHNAVTAFETRKDLIQSLSANMRKER